MTEVLLIDSLNLVHRSNISFGPVDPEKTSYHIIYNCLRSLKALVEKFQPSKVFFAWEGKSNFRYSMFPDYKASRIVKQGSQPKKRDEILRQADIISELLRHLSITQVRADKYEADDVIATLATNMKEERCTIVSTDSDYNQLLQKDLENLRIYNPKSKSYVDKPEFHYLVWKALRGDKSDSIPSLMSDNRALEMVSNPGALSVFLESEESRAAFNLNKDLIELRNIPEDDLQFSVGSSNFEYLEKEFDRMEFKTMLVPKYWERFKEVLGSL